MQDSKNKCQCHLRNTMDCPPDSYHVFFVFSAVRKQGFHNPNRFSREPCEYFSYLSPSHLAFLFSYPFLCYCFSVYRVIKNQPPPVLSINLDHNPFKCSSPGCTKSFRKAKLLHYHMKYYHGEDQPLEDLSPTRSVQTRASDKQTFPNNLESPKRRRTISASMCKSLTALYYQCA